MAINQAFLDEQRLTETKEYKQAMELEQMLNNMSFNSENFAKSIKHFHPTLQQKLFRLIRDIINVQADENRVFDDRNRASHKLAKELKKVSDNFSLPYI